MTASRSEMPSPSVVGLLSIGIRRHDADRVGRRRRRPATSGARELERSGRSLGRVEHRPRVPSSSRQRLSAARRRRRSSGAVMTMHLLGRFDGDARRLGVGPGEHEHVRDPRRAGVGVRERRVGVEVVLLPHLPRLIVGRCRPRAEAEALDAETLDEASTISWHQLSESSSKSAPNVSRHLLVAKATCWSPW
jgi:hypothetical protein